MGTERIVKAKRAWLYYKDRLFYVGDPDESGLHKVYSIPRGGEGGPYVFSTRSISWLVAFVDNDPLERIQVAYENGATLSLTNGPEYWSWQLEIDDRTVASSDVQARTNADAVHKAMVAASAWFTQAQTTTAPSQDGGTP